MKWSGYYKDRARTKVDLPTYPFEHKRHWFTPSKARTAPAGAGERQFSADGFVAGHRVFGEVIVPAAAFLELALSSASESGTVEDFRIHRAMPVGAETPKLARLVASETERGRFEIRGRDARASADTWVPYAAGRIGAQQQADAEVVDLALLRQQSTNQVSAREFYARCRRRGFSYGPAFQLIDRLWTKHGGALASIRRSARAAEVTGLAIDACTLDACFQVLLAILPAPASAKSIWLPVSVRRVRVAAVPGETIWCHAEIESVSDAELSANLRVMNDAGETIAVVEALTARQAARTELSGNAFDLDRCLYRPSWLRRSLFDAASGAALLPAPAVMAGALRDQLRESNQALSLDRCGEGLSALNALTAGYINAALRAMGLALREGERVEPGTIGAIPRHRALVDRLLGILEADGVLARDGDAWTVARTAEARDLGAANSALQAKYPEIASELQLAGRCGHALAAVLRGTREPITELLFPATEPVTAASLFRDARGSQVFNRVVATAIQQALSALPARRGVRILEVGAGMDGTISAVVPQLDGARTEYHLADVSRGMFTDVASAATQRIREQLAAFPFVSFHRLDLERDPVEQGFAAGSYDVVIAPNILHATQDLTRSASHLRQLLAPGGLMFLIEGTGPQAWVDLVYGMTPPWWSFTDTAVRANHPLISPDRWSDVLSAAGFEGVESFACEPAQQALIVAKASPAMRSTNRNEEYALVVADANGAGLDVADRLSQDGVSCTVVTIGPNDMVPEAALALCETLLDLTKRITVEHSDTRRLAIVTRGALSVKGEPAPGIAAAAMVGMARSIALEHPQLQCRVIDLPAVPSSDDAGSVIDELRRADGEEQVAYRDGLRYATRINRDASTPSTAFEARPDVTYLVTGGLGELGRHAAEWLLDRGAKHVTLVSRSDATSTAAEQIDRLKSDGIEIA
ncbi:MAG TPA: polyketide synthase dehydratase domain-containing protein, partial [Vicinamibacterales bacterium]|nr:polyketide synthase dehydratase domain-containing protein [Vicinamibacterales bacterium]